MIYYVFIEALAAIIIGLLIAICSKKASGVVYGKRDKIGRITNIILIFVYLVLSPLYLGLGIFSFPEHDGFLGILGWIIAVIISSAALFCGIGLGLSVALRKKGKSKQSFAVQFLGFVGIGLTVVLYVVFTGNLLSYLN